MNANDLPDLRVMTTEDAKAYLKELLQQGVQSDAFDLALSYPSRTLLEADDRRQKAAAMLEGGRHGRMVSYGGREFSETRHLTAVLYDAAWEMVLEGLLRPGPSFWDPLNPQPDSFCLTAKGREVLGL